MAEACSVCNEVEKYPNNGHVHYVCGTCVQTLLHTDQESILNAYKEAKEDGDQRYMWALRIFLRWKPDRIKMMRKIND